MFPVRWSGSQFKTPVSKKVVRGLKRQTLTKAEDSEKAKVRRRDKYCRFPLCGCRKFKLGLAVCHTIHRGMGGNPNGDRTQAHLMILLCSARHRENGISLDRHTLRVTPLTDDGYGGPCAFNVMLSQGWFEVARETTRHTYEPFTPEQRRVLAELALMTT